MRTKLNQNEVNSILGIKGGNLLTNNFNISIGGDDYLCSKTQDLASTVGDLASGGGLKKSKKFLQEHPLIDGVLLFIDDDGRLKEYSTINN